MIVWEFTMQGKSVLWLAHLLYLTCTSPRVILTSPKKLLMSNSSSDKVADLGESPRGPAPPALFLDQTEVQRAEKKFWRPPPHLRVWMTAPLPLI